MASDMLRRVDYKLSHVEPLTEEETLWLRGRLDTLYEQMAGVQPGEIVSIKPVDNENDDWVMVRYLPQKEESDEELAKV